MTQQQQQQHHHLSTMSRTLGLGSVTDRAASRNDIPQHVQAVVGNASLRADCVHVVFGDLDYLPWDNPDNIVSAEVETIVRRVKNNLLVLLFLIGGPANALNMAVFYQQGLKDRVNLCLFALSLADGLYLLMVVLHHGEQLVLQFTSGDRFGPVCIFMANWNLITLIAFCFVSPVLSTIIAVERCLCVLNPLKFQTLMRTTTMAAIIISVHVVVFGLFFLVSFRYRIGCVYDPSSGLAIVTGVEGEFYRAHKQFIDSLDSLLFGVGLPGMEMTVVTAATVTTIVKLRQAMRWRSETSVKISAREVALTKMLVGNSILFIACMSPTALIRFSWIFLPEVNAGRRQQNFFLSGLWVREVFTYINATFNMFVYYSMGSRYRDTLWALLGRQPQPGKA